MTDPPWKNDSKLPRLDEPASLAGLGDLSIPSPDVPRRIETGRLVIRPVEDEDAQGLWESADESRGTLLPWLPWVNHYTSVESARTTIVRWKGEWSERTALPYGIFDRETGEHLGAVGFVRIDWTVPVLEMGYWLRSTAVGRGVMTEAVWAMVIAAFRQLNAERVEIRMDPLNVRSRAVPERLGFVFEGRHRNIARSGDGKLRDQDVFALTAADFEERRESAPAT